MRAPRLFLALAVLLTISVACADGPTEALPPDVGHAEFQMRGALSRNFEVTVLSGGGGDPDPRGRANAQITPGPQGSGSHVMKIEAVSTLGAEKADRIVLYVPAPMAGTYWIPAPSTDTRGYRGIHVWINDDYPFGGSPDARFSVVSGRIRITSADGDRLRGTFTGTARQVDSTGFIEPAVNVEIRSGYFDVPIVQPHCAQFSCM